MIAVALGASAQLLMTGVLGEYVGRIAQETRHRPLYLVRDTYGIVREISHGIASGSVGPVPVIGISDREK